MKDVQWAESKAEAIEKMVLARNETGYPTIGQPQLWWVPAVKHANASAPRLAPWAPASLFKHWPPPPPAHPGPAHTGTRTHPHAHLHRRLLRRREPSSARRLLQLTWDEAHWDEAHPYLTGGQLVKHQLPAAEPQQLAGVPDLSDFKAFAWSYARMNHTSAAPCAGCAAGLAHRLEASTGLACADALALAVTSTALLTCLLTLVCVWLLTQHVRRQPPPPAKLAAELPPARVGSLVPEPDRM
jgi:hypothetical protein